MNKYIRPSKEDLYYQFVTLNKTNKQLSEYYKVSESVIHTWKRYYKMYKPIELIVKSYVPKGCFEKGHKTWNKGLKGHLNSEKCKATWFTSEYLAKKSEKNIGKPRDDKRKWLVCLTNDKKDVKNKRNDKIYKHRKTEGYARWILKQSGIDIPKGMIVYHKDGDYTNNNIGNLEIITRAELLKRNQKMRIYDRN